MSLGEKILDFADGIGEKIALGAMEIIIGLVIAIIVGVVLFAFGLPQNSIDKFFDWLFSPFPPDYRGIVGLILLGLFILMMPPITSWFVKWWINRKKTNEKDRKF